MTNVTRADNTRRQMVSAINRLNGAGGSSYASGVAVNLDTLTVKGRAKFYALAMKGRFYVAPARFRTAYHGDILFFAFGRETEKERGTFLQPLHNRLIIDSLMSTLATCMYINSARSIAIMVQVEGVLKLYEVYFVPVKSEK